MQKFGQLFLLLLLLGTLWFLPGDTAAGADRIYAGFLALLSFMLGMLLLHFQAMARDMTARNLAQLDFQRSVDVSPAILWITEKNGESSYHSQQWYTFTGQSSSEALGFGWMDAVHKDDRERVLEAFHRANTEAGTFYIEYRLRTTSGDYRWVIDAGNPRFDAEGAYLGHAGTIFDIHDKKVAQARLEETAQQIKALANFGTNTEITELREFKNAMVESEARFRDLANSMPQLVWTADADGTVDYYNERAAEFDGFQRDRDGTWSWQPGLHPGDLERTVEAWHEAIEKKKFYSCEHRARMLDGHYRWHLSRAVPVFQSDGRVKKWYGTATNIHEYKLALAELAKSKDSAEDANKAKSRFLANMSHEIRSPMTSVLGYADLLLERGLGEADRLSYAASIKASGEHLLAIIDDLLDLSAVESGEFKIDRHSFALVDLIAECIKSMAVLAQRKGLALDVEFKSPVPEFMESDPLRFRQILLNLLSNAIKFTEKGRIVVRLNYQDQVLNVEVEDSGLGIEDGKAQKLFRAFTQVDSSISRKFGGTGLGLHLSRRLAQALGGDLFLMWSIPGCGSSFALTVPSGQTDTSFVQSFQDYQRISAKAGPEKAAAQASYSVLLAEDSPDNQVLIKIFLKKLGAQVHVANNGEEALHMAMATHYDIILMDMMMPIMDGLEATRRLRALGYHKPIVALTAHALKEEVEKSIAAGCDLHLTKPIRIEVLRRTIQLLLHSHPDDDRAGHGLH